MSPSEAGVRISSLEPQKNGNQSSLRSCLFALFAWLAPLSALPAEGESDLIPRCGGPFMLCGYTEKDSKEERIAQQFEVAKRFSDGLAAVRVKGLYGFIDASGKMVIAPRFQHAGDFSGEYAQIRLNNAAGIINRSGKIVITPTFKRIFPFSGDSFIAEPLLKEPWRSVFVDGRLETLTEALPHLNGAGVFHVQKGWLSDQDLKFSLFDNPSRGLIWAGKTIAKHQNLWGLIRADGTWQETMRYHHVQQLVETHAVVGFSDLRGAVDRDGNLVVPLKFAGLSYWRGGYGIAYEGKPFKNGARTEAKQALVLADGELLADRYFDKVERGEKGGLPRGRIGATWYSIEPNGNMIPDDTDAGKLLLECPNGLSIVQRGEHVEFHRQGASPLGPFDTGFFQRSDCPGPFSVKREGRWFLVSEDGSVLGGKRGFENTYSFSGRTHTAVQLDGKWGIIDRSGAFTVQPIYDMLRPDRNDTFAVNERTEPFWINALGKPAEKPPKDIPFGKRTLNCAGGLRLFEKGSFWGLEGSDGKVVIEPKFRALTCFRQGIAWAAAPDSKAWCPIGSDGKRSEALECKEKYYPYTMSHSSPEFFSADPYENSVLWNRAWLEYLAEKRKEPPGWGGNMWLK